MSDDVEEDQDAFFTDLNAVVFLNADPRPNFVIKVPRAREEKGVPILPVFCNDAIHRSPRLKSVLVDAGEDLSQEYHDLWRSTVSDPQSTAESYDFAGFRWQSYSVLERWIVFSCLDIVKDDDDAVSETPGLESDNSVHDHFDWTTQDPLSLSPHLQFICAYDWEATPVGKRENWPLELRVTLNLLHSNPEPAVVYWGEEMNSFYNEPFIKLIAQKHPDALGHGPEIVFPEVWSPETAELFMSARRTGITTRVEHIRMCIKFTDFLEEIYFCTTIAPIISRHGSVLGVYQSITDTTAFNLAQRRLTTILALCHEANDVMTETWHSSLGILEALAEDVPFAALYSIESDAKGDTTPDSKSTHTRWRLEGTVGIVNGCLDLLTDDEAIAAMLHKACEDSNAGDSTLLRSSDGTLPLVFIDSVDAIRGFGDKINVAATHCLRASNNDSIHSILIIGLNPRLPYDENYKSFIKLVGTQFSTKMASLILKEEKRGRAALEKEKIAHERVLLKNEVKAAELKLERLSELSPVGLFMFRKDGSVIWRNEAWANMMPTPRELSEFFAWAPAIWPDDLEYTLQQWEKVTIDKKPIHFEFRSVKPWKGTLGRDKSNTDYTWILCSAYPELSETGNLLHVTGVLTEINEQKWIQDDSIRRAKEADDAKRQQEAFLDMTAHEIRNPLSVIIQCADAMKDTLKSCQNEPSMQSVVEECMTNIDTISYCGLHQKKVVDDILTLSKLDSDMLQITPVLAQPLDIIRQVLNIFDRQAKKSDLQINFTPAPSLAELNIDLVWLDTSRVLQILMNLMSNAIKFTADQSERVITITLDASLDVSDIKSRGIKFFPSEKVATVPTRDGTDVYLLFCVQDTGRGISPEEQHRLFKRFSQASIRTHVEYGGSGLGLWISRQLAEKQGGEIGILPDTQKGSVFAFYIRAQMMRATSQPQIATLPLIGLSHRTKQEHTFDLSQLEVLLVEDNLINQRVLQKQLKKIFKNVHVANHGLEALDVLKQTRHWRGDSTGTHEIAVVLLDVEMPVMGGVECVQNIRSYQECGKLIGHIPVIGTTANARLEQIQVYKNAGMDDVLPKPFRIPELVETVQAVLQRLSLA